MLIHIFPKLNIPRFPEVWYVLVGEVIRHFIRQFLFEANVSISYSKLTFGFTGKSNLLQYTYGWSPSSNPEIVRKTKLIAPKPYVSHQNSPRTDSRLYFKNAYDNRCTIIQSCIEFRYEAPISLKLTRFRDLCHLNMILTVTIKQFIF